MVWWSLYSLQYYLYSAAQNGAAQWNYDTSRPPTLKWWKKRSTQTLLFVHIFVTRSESRQCISPIRIIEFNCIHHVQARTSSVYTRPFLFQVNRRQCRLVNIRIQQISYRRKFFCHFWWGTFVPCFDWDKQVVTYSIPSMVRASLSNLHSHFYGAGLSSATLLTYHFNKATEKRCWSFGLRARCLITWQAAPKKKVCSIYYLLWLWQVLGTINFHFQ